MTHPFADQRRPINAVPRAASSGWRLEAIATINRANMGLRYALRFNMYWVQ